VTTSATRNRTKLSCSALEDRYVPAGMLDLTAAGQTGMIHGAIFTQAAGTGAINSFLRVDADGTEQGYNTDARPLQFDSRANRAVTHALKLDDVPVVTVAGVNYREFVLDVNQQRRSPQISLDQLQIFVGNVATLHNYNQSTGKLGGQTAVYSMDAPRDNNWVKLNANRGNADGDMQVLVPDAAFGGATYVYLFSRFGDHIAADGGVEEWGVRPISVTPPPADQSGSISGKVYFDNSGAHDPSSTGLNGYLVFIDANNDGMYEAETEVSTRSGMDGTYSFTGLTTGAGVLYTIRIDPSSVGGVQSTPDPDSFSLTAGESRGGIDFGISGGGGA
jgi:hypothetical protein